MVPQEGQRDREPGSSPAPHGPLVCLLFIQLVYTHTHTHTYIYIIIYITYTFIFSNIFIYFIFINIWDLTLISKYNMYKICSLRYINIYLYLHSQLHMPMYVTRHPGFEAERASPHVTSDYYLHRVVLPVFGL